MSTIARTGGGSCFRPCFYSCCLPCCLSCSRPCFCPCCWSCCRSCFCSRNVSDGWRPCLHSLEYLQPVAALAPALASVRAMSPNGGGSCWRSLECRSCWRFLECLRTVADSLPPVIRLLSFHIRLNVCCLLCIRLNVYPLPPPKRGKNRDPLKF